MVAIKFKKEFFQPIHVGSKTQTLRLASGRLNLRPGDFAVCVFEDHPEKIFITILEVGYTHFKDLTTNDAIREGLTSVKELKKVLLDIYPNLDDNTRLFYYRFEVDGYSQKIGS